MISQLASLIHFFTFLLWTAVPQVESFHDVYLPGAGNTTLPGWHTFPYFLDPPIPHTSNQTKEENSLKRTYVLNEQTQRAYLMCPKGFVIDRIDSHFHVSPEKDNETLYQTWIKPTTHDWRQQQQTVEHQTTCVSLKECLLYQACVFNFGNEFCMRDPLPGQRKLLVANVTCTSVLIESVPELIRHRMDKVLHITYKSQLGQLGIAPENIDLTATKLVLNERPEARVFGVQCPTHPYDHGYSGKCRNLNLTAEEVVHRTWYITSRIARPECQEKLVEVFCSIQYSPEDALCVPPGFLDQHTLQYSQELYPFRGPRPDHLWDTLATLQNSQTKALISPRIGFAFLVHSDVQTVLQLLESVYRPQHFYVFHVDLRKEGERNHLVRMLEERFINNNPVNIVVLPTERSFVTSWGSWGLVRALLETYEELCRLGVWDFAVDLSGADLPLRSVDDLSLALAPHRNESFLAFHGIGLKNAKCQMDEHAMKGLLLESWYSCDGFTFNVTRHGGVPTSDKFKMASASQWSVLSRHLVEDLLDQDKHSDTWKKYNYWMATSCIPDESYIPSFAVNSGHAVHNAALHYLKQFQGKDAYHLCRHLDDADFCGQGPSSIKDTDYDHLSDYSHRYFFARKFETVHPDASPRPQIIKLSQGGGYYNAAKHFLPNRLMDQLMSVAYGAHGQAPEMEFVTTKLTILPNLVPITPCCLYPFQRHFFSVQDYSYVIDFGVFSREGDKAAVVELRAKYYFRPRCHCYGFGHMRALRVTAWSKDHRHEDHTITQTPLSLNVPLNFFPEGATTVYAEMWLHTDLEILGKDCLDMNDQPRGEPIMVENLSTNGSNYLVNGDTVEVVAELVDPEGNVRVASEAAVEWNNHTIKYFTDPRDGQNRSFHGEYAHNFQLSAGYIEAGLWTIRLYKKSNDSGLKRPHVYEVPMLFLPSKAHIDTIGDKLDLMQGFWRLESVTDLFNTRGERHYTAALIKHPMTTLSSTTCQCLTCPPSSSTTCTSTSFTFYDWLTCGGGAVTILVVSYFCFCCLLAPLCYWGSSGSYLPGHHYRRGTFNKGAILKALIVVGLATLAQAVLCTFSFS